MAGKDASGTAPRYRKVNGPNTNLTLVLSLVLGVAGLNTLCVSHVAAQRPGPHASAAPVAAGPQRAPAPASTGQPQVMAVVNGEQISRQSLAQECLRRYGEEVLESMINKQIILQACQQRGVTITQKDVADEVHNIANKFGLSVDRWLSLLESERDVDPEQYRRDIVWPTLALRRLASEQVVVTQDELRRAIDSEYGPKVKARMIAVSSRAKADQLAKAATANPNDFARLAKEHSEDKATASAYGVIPPIRMHLGDPNLEQIAFSLKEGQISPVIQVANQYIILKCEQQIERTYVSSQHLPEVERRLKERIHDHKMRAESAQLFQQLQSQAQVINVYNDANLQRQYPGVAALVSGRQIMVLDLSAECVTRHGKETLEGEINRKLLVQELRRRNTRVEEQDIDREVARAADAYGYSMKDGTPDIDAWLKAVTEGDETTVELYVRDAVWPSVALKKLVSHKVQVNDDDLKKGFESNFGERVEVLAIVLTNHRQAQTVWDNARNNPTDQFFGELAHQYSVEPTSRANFGKVPPIRRHGGQPLVEKEAFGLNVGELSGIIAVADKYVILRCLGRTKPVVTEFDLVKDELQKDIHEKKVRIAMAKEFDRLKETAQIDNFLTGVSQSGKRLGPQTATPAGYNQPTKPRSGSIRR